MSALKHMTVPQLEDRIERNTVRAAGLRLDVANGESRLQELDAKIRQLQEDREIVAKRTHAQRGHINNLNVQSHWAQEYIERRNKGWTP